MSYKIVLAVIFSALVAPAAFASGKVDVSGLIQPGLYEITVQMSVKDMGAMPARTVQQCIKQDDVKNLATKMAERMKKSGGNMQIKNLSLHGKDLHFELTAPTGNLNVDMVFDDPTHYHQTMTGEMMGHQMTAHSTGHRIGECKKPAAH